MKMIAGITIQIAMIALAVVLIASWPVNLYKLTKCDFESDYKCEVLHGIGLFPAISFITVWVGTDE